MHPPYLLDAPTRDPALLRPRLRAVADHVASWLLASPPGTAVHLSGPHGSGRSTLLHALGERLPTTTVVRWDASLVPAGAPLLPALLGAVVASLDAPAEAASALRLPMRLAVDPVLHARAQPAPHQALVPLGEVLRQVIGGRSLVLLLDELDDATPEALDDLLRTLPLLTEGGADLRLIATLQDQAHPLVGKRLPHRFAVPPLDGPELVELLRMLGFAEGTPFTSRHQDALTDAFHAAPTSTARRVKAVLRRLHHLLTAEAGTTPFAAQSTDPALIRWLVAEATWPALPIALRERDDRWWRDLRLALEQAMARRPDALVDQLLDAPGLPGWLVTTLPNPQRPPGPQLTFALVLDALRESQARLDRWGL
jgi:hypothetical protein